MSCATHHRDVRALIHAYNTRLRRPLPLLCLLPSVLLPLLLLLFSRFLLPLLLLLLALGYVVSILIVKTTPTLEKDLLKELHDRKERGGILCTAEGIDHHFPLIHRGTKCDRERESALVEDPICEESRHAAVAVSKRMDVQKTHENNRRLCPKRKVSPLQHLVGILDEQIHQSCDVTRMTIHSLSCTDDILAEHPTHWIISHYFRMCI